MTKSTLVMCVLIATGVARADSVYTTDGSKIVGRVELMANGELIISSDILGRVKLDATHITAIHIDEKLNVEFESGDRLIGTIDVSADQSQSTMKTALGDVNVKPANIKSIWPVGGESPEILAARAAADVEIKRYKPVWTTTLEIGASSRDGNTDTLSARGRFDLKRTTTQDLLHFYLAANYDEQNDLRTTNEYFGGIKYRNDINKSWFWYARTELEFDEFEDLDLRTTVAAGAGYYWIREPAHELSNTFGTGYRYESYNNGRTSDDAIIDLGLDYRVDIAPWVQFTHSTVYSPGFQDLSDYRLSLDSGLFFPLKDDRFKIKFGMRNVYNSRPQPGFDRLDNTYYANLVISLTD